MNHGTYIVNVAKDPEQREIGESKIVRLRVADSTFGKNSVTNFFNAEFRGRDAEAVMKLKSGNQIAIVGTLKKVTYRPKSGPNKGKKVEDFEMPFANLLQVLKSETFFGGEKAEPDAEPEDTTEPTDVDDPMADLRA